MIRKSTYDLGLLIAGNICAAELPYDVERHYLTHVEELGAALRRGLVLPTQEIVVARPVKVIVPPPPVIPAAPRATFKVADTDLEYWLDQTQRFAKKRLGVKVDLRRLFAIPLKLPWKSAIPVFDPGGLDNGAMVSKALKGLGLVVYEEAGTMNYAGSEANKAPTLHLIKNSIRPDAWTLTNPGTPPNLFCDTGKLFLRLRGYGLAFAVYYFVKKEWLDPSTFTWFPKDCRSNGDTAFGGWDLGEKGVRFGWDKATRGHLAGGARVAIPVRRRP